MIIDPQAVHLIITRAFYDFVGKPERSPAEAER